MMSNMETKWSQSALQQLIDSESEESLTLEYKGAGSLKKTDKEKIEITKDVSAMANSDGGTLIYGIKEYDEKDKKHLPEKLEAIDRRQFSKEWLEQVASNIRPRIEGLIIHPVNLDTGENDVAYVVEIPRSNTAHQARDYRYYMRYNFESVPMEDYQVRDVMHRGVRPDVTVGFMARFSRHEEYAGRVWRKYHLRVFVKNNGSSLVDHVQVVFSTPKEIRVEGFPNIGVSNIEARARAEGGYRIVWRSTGVLFPEEEREISTEFPLVYARVDEIDFFNEIGRQSTLNWLLYADDMTPKSGQIPLWELEDSRQQLWSD